VYDTYAYNVPRPRPEQLRPTPPGGTGTRTTTTAGRCYRCTCVSCPEATCPGATSLIDRNRRTGAVMPRARPTVYILFRYAPNITTSRLYIYIFRLMYLCACVRGKAFTVVKKKKKHDDNDKKQKPNYHHARTQD